MTGLAVLEASVVVSNNVSPDTSLFVIVIGCEKSNWSFVEFQSIEASVLESTASCIVIPAPFAEDDVSPEPKFKVIFLSSTSNVAVFKVVVVPLTVKLPVTAKLPPTVALLILVKFLELSTISVPFNLKRHQLRHQL